MKAYPEFLTNNIVRYFRTISTVCKNDKPDWLEVGGPEGMWCDPELGVYSMATPIRHTGLVGLLQCTVLSARRR